MRLRFTPLALADVESILTELAMRSSQMARKVRQRLREVTGSVREFPKLGQLTDAASVRRIVLRPYPYLLFYRVVSNEIVVIGMRHAARDPASMPDDETPNDLP